MISTADDRMTGQVDHPVPGRLTEARREEGDVEIGDKFLHLGPEAAVSGNDVSRRAHAHDLEHRFEDQEREMAEGGMRRVWSPLRHPEHGEGVFRIKRRCHVAVGRHHRLDQVRHDEDARRLGWRPPKLRIKA